MKARLVVIGIDDICRLFRDYTYLTGFPQDAKCETLLFNKAEGRMCIRISSDEFDGRQAPEKIQFDLQKTFVVS